MRGAKRGGRGSGLPAPSHTAPAFAAHLTVRNRQPATAETGSCTPPVKWLDEDKQVLQKAFQYACHACAAGAGVQYAATASSSGALRRDMGACMQLRHDAHRGVRCSQGTVP